MKRYFNPIKCNTLIELANEFVNSGNCGYNKETIAKHLQRGSINAKLPIHEEFNVGIMNFNEVYKNKNNKRRKVKVTFYQSYDDVNDNHVWMKDSPLISEFDTDKFKDFICKRYPVLEWLNLKVRMLESVTHRGIGVVNSLVILFDVEQHGIRCQV